MHGNAELAKELSGALRLSLPPIAVCLSESEAVSAPRYEGKRVPAGCVFWQEAVQGPFVTEPLDHGLCSIGMYTHNMELSAQARQDLGDALKVFADIGYLPADQVPGIPVLAGQPRRVVYGPLASVSAPPDVVLLFVEPDQALIVTEATQVVDGGVAPAMGRPACAAIPAAVNGGRAALSLGCCGARTYLDALGPTVQMFALPGARLAEYVRQISTFSRANTTLARFHQLRRRDVERGLRPSVSQSLARLQQ
ncbi:MAG: DUF169 domain-containing protein [Bryobacteraceae bacterium]|nr:DUF169 domain-containing protein [Bryobacteraceae bacterium]